MSSFSEKIEALAAVAGENPVVLMRLAVMLREDGQMARAESFCRRAMAAAGNSPELMARARDFRNSSVPKWHFALLRDEPRNRVYDQALQQVVTPGCKVLEIGAGTGLLAMMAARAGAGEVITCEMNPAMAEMATEIVRRNGYADSIRVICKHSSDLDVEADLGGPADLLVSEIVSNNLLSEGVLPSHEYALQHLVRPGAPVIPAGGRIRVALAHDRQPPPDIGTISGFDLSPLNDLAPVVRNIGVGLDRLVLRGPGTDLFDFSFGQSGYCQPGRADIVLRSDGGKVSGVVQWIALSFAGGEGYENRPAIGSNSNWTARFYPFPRPIETVAGQEIRIGAAHDRHNLFIWSNGD